MKPVMPMFKSALLALTTMFSATALVFAKETGEWKVEGELFGKKDMAAEDLSGIACATDSGFPRTCLVIDDEQQSAQVVILILAGPMQDIGGTYSVYWWDAASNNTQVLMDLPDFVSEKGKQWKPEALLPLDRDAGNLRVLVLLDSAKQGKPRVVRIPYPAPLA